MKLFFISNQPELWPKEIHPSVTFMSAREYILKQGLATEKAKVYNLCNSVKYQSLGYYVSLLAEARGHRPMPSISTIQDFNNQRTVKYLTENLQDLIQDKLNHLQADQFVLSIYFGHNLAKHYDRLVGQLFSIFPAPLMRAYFKFEKVWKLTELKPISLKDVAGEHQAFVQNALQDFLNKKRQTLPTTSKWRYDLAILHSPHEKHSPSDARALKLFAKAAAKLGIRTELIEKGDYSRIAEFDALFIRETTQVNHHTYKFARKAQSEGLVVLDDPESILKCTNKVFLAELLARHKVPTPKSIIVHRGNVKEIGLQIGFPCILKQPDSSFSQGVFKAKTEEECDQYLEQLFDSSELVIAQEFMPTPFDWRIGIINQKPIYACKYFMAGKHWQIIQQNKRGISTGKSESVPVGWAPKYVIQTALKAANLIGDGLYGVDLKEVDGKPYIIEVNDNPSIDADVEDFVLKEELYSIIMSDFLRRIEENKKV